MAVLRAPVVGECKRTCTACRMQGINPEASRSSLPAEKESAREIQPMQREETGEIHTRMYDTELRKSETRSHCLICVYAYA